ncbi:glycosyltransferase family 2 protein [Caulobacter sp. S45]|uniref:glycosyltransferase family 2 protein n=1 Tax=Caulobacter sp. S45 TaxID=1641861 RepID=UPI00131D6C92|nr:glycosyltransferase family 2 protein [Caulobacter sp. S45]
MYKIECALADSFFQPMAQTPLLTVVVPTFQRPDELWTSVNSIASQIVGELVGKVEIIVTDNASGPETASVLKRLAAAHPSVSYMIHAKNEGGAFQVYAAPHRAHGRWTWVFGDDDALSADSLGKIVAVLEVEQPEFLTLDRQVWNKSFDIIVSARKHGIEDQKFKTFIHLINFFGFDQLSFWSSQIYMTSIAASVSADHFIEAECCYSQIAYYLHAFHDKAAYYFSEPVVRHRWDASASSVHARNFHHLATHLPMLIQRVSNKIGLDDGLFERINGRRSIQGPETRRVTFVDNIFENLWRCVALGTVISEEEWDALNLLSKAWRPDGSEQLQAVRDFHDKMKDSFQAYTSAINEFRQVLSTAELDIASSDREAMETAVRSLAANIDAARKLALQISHAFN